MSDRPTLKDVAAKAGVSFKTVSRVVNDEPGVSSAIAERVRSAVAELGYRRNHSAQVLRRSDARLQTVAIVHADATNPFAAAVHASFERYLRTTADTLVVSASSHGDAGEHDRLVDLFTERRVDGLAVIPVSDSPGPALRRELARLGDMSRRDGYEVRLKQRSQVDVARGEPGLRRAQRRHDL